MFEILASDCQLAAFIAQIAACVNATTEVVGASFNSFIKLN